MSTRPLFVTTLHAAELISRPEDDVLELVQEGEISAVRIKGQLLIVYDSLFAYAKRLVRQGVQV